MEKPATLPLTDSDWQQTPIAAQALIVTLWNEMQQLRTIRLVRLRVILLLLLPANAVARVDLLVANPVIRAGVVGCCRSNRLIMFSPSSPARARFVEGCWREKIPIHSAIK